MVLRVVLLVVAVLACAWFALGIVEAHDLNAATAIASSPSPPAGALRHADSLLDGASRLNPDQQVNVIRAQLEVDRGQFVRARATLHRVVHREVNNLQAWLMMGQASSGDLTQAEAAHYVVTRLVRMFPAPR